MPPVSPTIGQQCAVLLKAAKEKATAAGQVMSWGEVASIIDRVCPPPKGKRPAKAAPALFGDPHHIPPAPEQVEAYSAAIGYPMNGAAWCDSYAQKGWKVGKSKMKNWQAAVRNWKTNGWGEGAIATGPKPAGPGKDYSKL